MLPEYLNKHAFVLKSVTDDDFSDLQPLKDILNNVRIVGLGESTHGTGDFFRLKHRLTRFLVKEMGFRVFSLEAGMLPCMNIGEYAAAGKGNRASALASQGYWTWDTEEFTDLIEWMHEYNLKCERGDECRFIGYDVKPISEAASAVRRIIKKGYPDLYDKADAIIHTIEAIPFPFSGDNAPSDEGILWLWGAIVSNELTISRLCGRASYELLLTSCRMLWEYMDSMILCPDMSGRDRNMAENIIRIVESLPHDAKIIVWAHNFHISRRPDIPNMGELLHRHFGDQYFAFALTFTRGSFQSRLIPEDGDGEFGALQEFTLKEPHNGFWERELMQHKGSYFLDLRSARKHDEETYAWSSQSKQLFGAGGGYIPLPEDPANEGPFFHFYTLGEAFDGIFHIENTTRAHPTPTGMRKAGQASK